MRRSLAGFIFLILSATAALPAHGAGIPDVSGPVAYRGKHGQGNNAYRVFLYLGLLGDFVLREEADLPNGKVSAWDVTGKWHQIRNGALLQLVNKTGYRRTANVGGAGHVYLDVRLPSGERETVTLRPYGEGSPELEFTVSGTLRVSERGIVLRDEASGMDHLVPEEKIIADFLAENRPVAPLFVRAAVVASTTPSSRSALHIKAIQAIPALKQYGNNADASVFRETVCGARWHVIRIGNEVRRDVHTLFFSPPEGSGGRVDAFDGLRHVVGKYVLQNANLTLIFPGAAAALSGQASRIRSWDLAGEVLELRGQDGVLAVLEKVR